MASKKKVAKKSAKKATKKSVSKKKVSVSDLKMKVKRGKRTSREPDRPVRHIR